MFFIGEASFFHWFCSLPGVWRVFPNVHADHEVEITSNWSIIIARNAGCEPDKSTHGEPALFSRVGGAKIPTRLSRVEIALNMDDKYLSSETVTCSVLRHRGDRKPALFYIYDSQVLTPKQTDCQRHLGAVRLSIPQERRPQVLEGKTAGPTATGIKD